MKKRSKLLLILLSCGLVGSCDLLNFFNKNNGKDEINQTDNNQTGNNQSSGSGAETQQSSGNETGTNEDAQPITEITDEIYNQNKNLLLKDYIANLEAVGSINNPGYRTKMACCYEMNVYLKEGVTYSKSTYKETDSTTVVKDEFYGQEGNEEEFIEYLKDRFDENINPITKDGGLTYEFESKDEHYYYTECKNGSIITDIYALDNGNYEHFTETNDMPEVMVPGKIVNVVSKILKCVSYDAESSKFVYFDAFSQTKISVKFNGKILSEVEILRSDENGEFSDLSNRETLKFVFGQVDEFLLPANIIEEDCEHSETRYFHCTCNDIDYCVEKCDKCYLYLSCKISEYNEQGLCEHGAQASRYGSIKITDDLTLYFDYNPYTKIIFVDSANLYVDAPRKSYYNIDGVNDLGTMFAVSGDIYQIGEDTYYGISYRNQATDVYYFDIVKNPTREEVPINAHRLTYTEENVLFRLTQDVDKYEGEPITFLFY